MERRVNLSECLKEGKMKNCCRGDVKMSSLEAEPGAASIWDNYAAFPGLAALVFRRLDNESDHGAVLCYANRHLSCSASETQSPEKLRSGGVGGGVGVAPRSEEDRVLGRVGETPIGTIGGTRSFRLPGKSLARCKKKLKRIMWEK